MAAYSNSFTVPFLFDDVDSIPKNPSILALSSLRTAFSPPPGGLTVSGRPVLNLSFALNFHFAGLDVRAYHATNLVIHILAGFFLMGIIRRTLLHTNIPWSTSTLLAWGAALLWLLHPLQTESVTYIVQRAESLAGLLYLLTLYAVVRGAHSRAAVPWHAAAVAACATGMMAKETVATAPLIVLAYDRVFLSPSFMETVRRRGLLYLGLFASWGFLVTTIIRTGFRGGTVTPDGVIAPLDYALTQVTAIVHYLRLAFWSSPLVFDYGALVVRSPAAIIPAGLVVGALLGVTLWALCRAPKWGFLGLWFFLVLAPSSSIVPIVTQTIAEHRMYLSLAAISVLVVVGGWLAIRSYTPRLPRLIPVIGFLVLATALGAATHRRNADYRSARAIWTDTAAKRPQNPRAYTSLAKVLLEEGSPAEALSAAQRALDADPHYARGHNNAGLAAAAMRDTEGAFREYDRAIQDAPDYAPPFLNRGNLLSGVGRFEQAIQDYDAAIARKKDYASAYSNRGVAWAQLAQLEKAIADFNTAIRLDPTDCKAYNNLGVAHCMTEPPQPREALENFTKAAGLCADYADAWLNQGNMLLSMGRSEEAILSLSQAVRLRPRHLRALLDRGHAYAAAGENGSALADFAAALEIDPSNQEALEARNALRDPAAHAPAPASSPRHTDR